MYAPMPIVTPVIIPVNSGPMPPEAGVMMALCIVLAVLSSLVGAVISWLRGRKHKGYSYDRPDPVMGALGGAIVGMLTPLVVGAFALVGHAILK